MLCAKLPSALLGAPDLEGKSPLDLAAAELRKAEAELAELDGLRDELGRAHAAEKRRLVATKKQIVECLEVSLAKARAEASEDATSGLHEID